jgi:hypothetical protein
LESNGIIGKQIATTNVNTLIDLLNLAKAFTSIAQSIGTTTIRGIK